MVKPTADTLVRNMAFFFVPAGVGLLVQGEILRREWLPIVIASVVSALAVLVVVGRLAQRMEKR
jgi:holin-like protein